MDTALLKASNFLEQVPRYPDDADKPLIRSGNPFSDFIAWFILVPRPDGTFQGEISELYNFVDDFVKARMERVPGVSLGDDLWRPRVGNAGDRGPGLLWPRGN